MGTSPLGALCRGLLRRTYNFGVDCNIRGIFPLRSGGGYGQRLRRVAVSHSVPNNCTKQRLRQVAVSHSVLNNCTKNVFDEFDELP